MESKDGWRRLEQQGASSKFTQEVRVRPGFGTGTAWGGRSGETTILQPERAGAPYRYSGLSGIAPCISKVLRRSTPGSGRCGGRRFRDGNGDRHQCPLGNLGREIGSEPGFWGLDQSGKRDGLVITPIVYVELRVPSEPPEGFVDEEDSSDDEGCCRLDGGPGGCNYHAGERVRAVCPLAAPARIERT